MACRLAGSKPLSDQCWNIVNLTLRNKLQWNLNRNSSILIQENTYESVVFETAAILSRPQCVKDRTYWIVCIYTCHIEIWGITWFCVWPYCIYNVNAASWEYHAQTWIELSSLARWYSIVYTIPNRCINVKRSINVSSGGMYQWYKDMDDQKPFEIKRWQSRMYCDIHS